MNDHPAPNRAVGAYVLGILGSFLVIAALAWAIHRYTQPAPLGEDRAAVRAKALMELRAAEAEAINNTGWMDPTKDLVRLRVEDAMKIIERDWGRNPVAGRSNLIERVEKATVAPPKAPEKPSPFE